MGGVIIGPKTPHTPQDGGQALPSGPTAGGAGAGGCTCPFLIALTGLDLIRA